MRTMSFHVFVLQITGKKCTKIQNASAKPVFLLINLLFDNVFVSAAVVVC